MNLMVTHLHDYQ